MFDENTKTQPLFTVKGDHRLATSTMLSDLDEYRRVLDIHETWKKALPALARIVNVNQDAIQARLFQATSPDHDRRSLAVQELTRTLEKVLELVEPKHDQGWATAEERPSIAVPSLLRAIRGIVPLRLPKKDSKLDELKAKLAGLDGPEHLSAKHPATASAPAKRTAKKRKRKQRKTAKASAPTHMPTGKGFFRYTDAQVQEVRKLGKKKVGAAEIAERMGMSRSYVVGILAGKLRPEVTTSR